MRRRGGTGGAGAVRGTLRCSAGCRGGTGNPFVESSTALNRTKEITNFGVRYTVSGGCKATDRRRQATDGGWKVTDGGWRVTDGGWRVIDGGWGVTDGGWRVTDGGWRVTDGGWRVIDGGWRVIDGGSRRIDGICNGSWRPEGRRSRAKQQTDSNAVLQFRSDGQRQGPRTRTHPQARHHYAPTHARA